MSNAKKPEQKVGSHQLSSASTVAQDVSEFFTSSEPFADSEARFHAFFDAAPLAIGIVRDGVLLYANAALAALVGVLHPSQIRGRQARDFIAPTQREEITGHARARVKSGLPPNMPYETVVRKVDGTYIPVRTEIAPVSLPGGDAVIAFAFDLSNERRAHDEIKTLLEREKRSAHFARQLQQFSQVLSDASSPDEVALISVERCMEAVGGVGVVFVVPCPGEDGKTQLCLSQSRGYSAEAVAGWGQIDVSAPVPLAHSFRENEAVWVSDVNDAQAIKRFPVLSSAHQTGTRALVTLPLRFDVRVVGVLGLTFDTPHHFDPEERIFMETLAAGCAQALERARLHAEGEELARRQRESLALLNTLLDSAPVGFGLFDRKHRYILVNEELARIDLASVEEHIGKRPTDIPFLKERGEEFEKLLEQVWETGLPSGEVEFTRGALKNSDFSHFSLALYPIRVGATSQQSGEMLGVGVIVIEQTERKRVEGEREELVSQLEVERARFEAILQQMPSGVMIAEAPSGRMILRNEQAVEIWGNSISGWETRNLPPALHQRRGYHSNGQELQANEWPLSRALQGEVVRGEEVLIERGPDDIGVVRANSAPIRDSDGTISAAVVVFDNITARARADFSQSFLAEAGAVLVSAVDEAETFRAVAHLCVPQVANWCAFVIPDTRSSFAVAALAGGEARNSHNSKSLEALLRRGPNMRKAVADIMERARGAVCSVHEIDETDSAGERVLERLGVMNALIAPVVVRGRAMGAMVWLNTSSKQPYDSITVSLAESVGRRVGVAADSARLLQEAKQARDAAQRARDEAEAANRAKDEFLAVVSHELRTPLTPILGWLELLRSPEISPELRSQAYDVIERNAIAQAQLVNDILDVSRITTGKLRLELRDISLEQVVNRSVDSLRTIWEDKKLQVEQHLETHIHVRADANRIGQVVWNLLQNAIKFTPAGGKIEISLRKCVVGTTGLTVARLEVRDNGAGIAPEFLPHVFERFRQGDSSSTRKTGGLGLGLAIVRHIVELHGGQVGVESEGQERGTTFWVEVPIQEKGQAFAPFTSPMRVIEGRLKGARILVVDDEPDTREIVARLLEEAGATVRVVPGGRVALEVVPQFMPSLIVSDIGMPDMNGLQLRRELLERGFQAPAIALTAYASGKDKDLTAEAGFERYLAKPVGTQELVEVAANLLAST